jgi:hypothetical protein
LHRFRYRTAAIVGPWRRTRDEAVADAIRAKQATRSEEGELVWTVAGEIEEEDRDAA